jgi:dihydrofolate reductase
VPVTAQGGIVRASVFIAASLDGYIARSDGAIDWLMAIEDPEGEDYGFVDFMKTVDTIVMGRHTYDKVIELGGWHYGATPVVVLTSRRPTLPAAPQSAVVEPMSGHPREIVARLDARGAQHLYVDGGQTIQAFLREGLIQQMTVTRIPTIIGSGIRLFGEVPRDIRARHVATQSFPNGLVQSRYELLP